MHRAGPVPQRSESTPAGRLRTDFGQRRKTAMANDLRDPARPRDPFFFGYGSLVNRATHDYPRALPARVRGWRRVWRHTRLRELAFLSVHPVPGAEIDGLVAAVPGADWAALDLRERAYDRVALCPSTIEHRHPERLDVQLYRTSTAHESPPDARHPVLLSYVDTVAQGFLQMFGRNGAEAFFASTDGWEIAVIDDRAFPRYPRATALSAFERGLVDQQLDRLGVERLRG
jgi:hypothetical protein